MHREAHNDGSEAFTEIDWPWRVGPGEGRKPATRRRSGQRRDCEMILIGDIGEPQVAQHSGWLVVCTDYPGYLTVYLVMHGGSTLPKSVESSSSPVVSSIDLKMCVCGNLTFLANHVGAKLQV